MTVAVVTFYRFVAIADVPGLVSALQTEASGRNLRGTILVAPEGINATLAGDGAALGGFVGYLTSDPRFADLDIKHSTTDIAPFKRMKVKAKREIVTFGVPSADPSAQTGTPIGPDSWDELISNPDVVLIDTRNSYEVGIGSFPGAIDPGTSAFSEFPAFVERHRKAWEGKTIAMFCTGGIRCEKASAYLLGEGFPDVCQLKGGILRYLEMVPAANNRFQGECFVFDERVSLTLGVEEGSHSLCATCGGPVSSRRACARCQS